MRDLSLHVLDIVQNSISAGANLIQVSFTYKEDDWLEIVIKDDGKGMSEEFLQIVKSPFATSRTTRKVGLGIPLFVSNARLTGGDVRIQSEENVGTVLTARFLTSNIDCLPLGDIIDTSVTLILLNSEKPDFIFSVDNQKLSKSDDFDTRQVREVLAGVSLAEPEVIDWIRESLETQLFPLFGGALI